MEPSNWKLNLNKWQMAIVWVLLIGVAVTALGSRPQQKIVGAWEGSGTLDVEGETPFDGAEAFDFSIDTVVVTVDGEEKTYGYDIYPDAFPTSLILKTNHQEFKAPFSLEEDTLTVNGVEFTRVSE